ncbi:MULTISPECIES: phage holin family protein [Halomonadaceae]|uniref:phage holin family protein n=1 Tax=Halomonadaceae TaxID=28256 RepID=UPI0018A473E5|nr:phage holin family protein [Halomonas sp. MCCC 1A13316]QOR37666.1 phage holin family protein [Halomonas sp. MCCC 1A13316]
MEADNRIRTESASLGSLFTELAREVTALVRKESELAKVEMSEKTTKVMGGIASIATAGAVLFSGFLVLLAAAVFGLNTVLPPEMTPWLSALIVGGVVVVIGLIMLQAGRKKLKKESLMPTRTMASLRRDKELTQEHEEAVKEELK